MMLYREVSYLDFKTFLPSGRSEGGDGFTVDNLEKEGFHEWVKFIPRYDFTVLLLSGHLTLHSPILVGKFRWW